MPTKLFLLTSIATLLLILPVLEARRCAKYCSCRGQRMKCYGKKTPLNTIPRPPEHITTVEIVKVKLDHITRHMVANLSHGRLKHLYLHGNRILRIDRDAFKDLKSIERFKWNQDFISIQDINNVLLGISDQLKRFYVKAHASNTVSMDGQLFLRFPHLTHIRVSLRSLQIFDTNDFTHLLALKHLDLSGNSLNNIIIQSPMFNVTDLNLSGNNFNVIPKLCNPKSLLPRLRDLNIGENAIRTLDVGNLKCLKNLQKLSLSDNRIDILPNNGFAGLTKLYTLNLQRLPVMKILPYAFNSSSLGKVIYSMNPTLTRQRVNPATMFLHTPNLQNLNMMNTKLNINQRYLKDFLLTLKNIWKLVFQGSKIKALPSGVFSNLKKLEILILSGNYISYWRKEVFEYVTSIKELVLDGCNIKMITEESFPLDFRLHVKEINLANNPFICTCELLWFRDWMKEAMANKSIKFSSYPYRYECRAPNTNRIKLKDFNPTIESCTPLPWYVIFLPILFGSLLIICVSGLVAYRYRWYLFYWLSLLRRRRQRQYMTPKEVKYDAFVSYSNEDSDWVYDELLHYLEGQIGLRLCEHSRDFKGGKLIVDNVFDALDTSNKTILVLSNDYMKSDWCQFELQMALNSFFKHETDLVVVMLGQIRQRQMTSSLRALLTSTTYIEWPPDDQTRSLFRERLKHSMIN